MQCLQSDRGMQMPVTAEGGVSQDLSCGRAWCGQQEGEEEGGCCNRTVESCSVLASQWGQ